jgi:hypothetical protein
MYTMGGALTFLSVESMACLGGLIVAAVVERQRTNSGERRGATMEEPKRNDATGERAVVKTRRAMFLTANRDAIVFDGCLIL